MYIVIEINQSYFISVSIRKQQVQCNSIWNYRDGGLPEKQVVIKMVARYYVYMRCQKACV